MSDSSIRRYHHTPEQRLQGSWAYVKIVVVLTPVISVMACGLLHGLLDWAGLNTDIAGYAMWVALPVVGVLLTRFAIRDYRRRA